MTLEIIQIQASGDSKKLNEEWIVVENTGDLPLTLRGCEVAKGTRKHRKVAKLDPGFTLQPQEKRRLVSGNPRSTVQGQPPEDSVENYFLFLKVAYLEKPGLAIKILRGQGVLAQARWEPKKDKGVGKETKKPSPEKKVQVSKNTKSSPKKKKTKNRSKKGSKKH